MKHTIKYLAAITIFTTLFLLALFCPNTDAQTSKKVKSPDKEQLEVQKFVDSFIRSFEETKDFNQVPESFFVSDFKTRLLKNNDDWNISESDFFAQLSDAERYDQIVTSISYLYLGVLCNIDKKAQGENKNNDDEVEKQFPSEIAKLIKKNKFLNSIYNDIDNDAKIKNIIELQNLTTDMKNIVEAERKYLIQDLPKRKSKYSQDIREFKKTYNEIDFRKCAEENCLGLPEQTQIITVVEFPLVLDIIKENNKLKLLNIALFAI